MASFEHAGDTVLQWQDDIYLTRPLKVSEIKYWYEGNLEQAIERSFGGYKTLVENTARVITEDKLFFDIHAPIIYEQHYLKQVLNNYKWHKRAYLVKTLYVHETGGEGEEMKDCKLHEKEESRMEKIKGSLFFSTSPQAIDPEMIEIFNELFPNPCRYEKT